MKYTTLILSLYATLVACSDRDVLDTPKPNTDKTPIELAVGGVDAPDLATRAVITDGMGKTLNAFDVDTKIFMVMKSEYGTTDYEGSNADKYNVARGDVAVTKNDNNWSIVDFDTKNQRYWDDAHARSSELSIWAYAQKGQSEKTAVFNSVTYDTDGSSQPFAWTTTEIVPTIVTWRAGNESNASQDETSVQAQDLLFSNNLVNYDTNDSDPSKDKRLKFNFTTRKFPQVGEANMIFYHAMSKITINIIEGEGFDHSSDADFQFKSNTNVQLNGFNISGTFDIKQGVFTSTNTGAIPTIYNKGFAKGKYTLEALVVPGTDLYNSTETKAFDFVIDDNDYKVTAKTLAEAIRAWKDTDDSMPNSSFTTLEAGKHYVFTFTVGKSKIKNLTAQVVGWEDVNADNVDPSNARITLNLEERGDALTNSDRFSFYRAAKDNTGSINDNYTSYDWKTGYNTIGVTPTYESTPSAHWSTEWYWDSNLNFYHFRALAKDNGSAKVVVPNNVVTDATNGDYYALSHGETYDDILWGAPMKDVEPGNETSDAATLKWNYGPTINGFDGLDTKADDAHQIYKAIGPTKDAVKLILFHMMSDVTINVKTTTDADKVELCHDNGDGHDPRYTRTRVDLVGYYKDGKVLLGSGLVKTNGSASTESSPISISFNSATDNTQYVQQVYKFGAIPQDLTNVVLVITTPDHNQYKVKLWDAEHPITATVTNHNLAIPYVESSTAGKYKINRWYPGFKYTYSFTLAKTGITNLQATIVDWEEVEADDEIVQIK